MTIMDMHDDTVHADAIATALERLAAAFDYDVVDRCDDDRCPQCGAAPVSLAA